MSCQLNISDKQYQILRNSRDLVRESILNGFRNWGHILRSDELLISTAHTESYKLKLPKFRMQGSFAYKTLNIGDQVPPQEIDLDDGLFLPVSYEEFTGNPEVLSEALFKIVEASLKSLCEKKGWRLGSKDTCVRVNLNNNSHAHIDIALYAIEKKQYYQLKEALVKKMSQDDSHFFDNLYKTLPSEFIMLAHRKHGWIPSDPRKLEDWFMNAINTHGYQLRRICRYLKGWRDYQWEDCKLSSISLMKAVVDIFQMNKYRFDNKRDDIAINNIVSELPNVLMKRIKNPVISGMFLDEEWSDEERKNFADMAFQLQIKINQAVSSDSEKEIINHLKLSFGNRIPNDVNLIQTMEHSKNSTVKAAATSILNSKVNSSDPTRPVKKNGGGRYA